MVHRVRPLVFAGATLGMILTVAGCTSDSESSSGPMPYVAEFAPGWNNSAEQEFVLVQGFLGGGPLRPGEVAHPSVAWANNGEYLAITTYGSGSCPAGPYGIDVVADQEVQIRLGALFPDRDACSADLSPHVTIVEVPEGVTSTEPLLARFADSEVTVPAVTGN